MLIHVDLNARLATIEIEKYFGTVLKSDSSINGINAETSTAYTHHLRVPLAIITIKEFKHVCLESFAIFVDSFASLFQPNC